MPRENQERHHYSEVLEQLKTCFPYPVSNPVMDGYFIHAMSRFLDKVDDLKSAVPILGLGDQRPYLNSQASAFPEELSTVQELTGVLVDYCRGMPVWGHPNSQVNVVPTTSIPSIMAFMAGAIYNPNIIWDEYSARFAEAEIEAVAMVSDLVGYDPQQSGGVFTFSGTGTIFYGVKLALERLFGGRLMQQGLREEVKIVASASAHYAKLNAAGWLGVGMRNLVAIPATRDSEMSLPDLEDYLRQAFGAGEKVALIIATMGTTDAFGLDDLAGIVQLRDQLSQEYRLAAPPYIHADAVIGWIWAVFRDYDFDHNPLGFRGRTLRALRDSVLRLSSLGQADSLGVDFHKTGYAPYISSAFLVRDRRHLTLLCREPDKMPYLYQFGHYRPGIYTLECSRPGTGALAALASMRLFGKKGYRVLIGHIVEMAQTLRERLEAHPFIDVLNDFNYGPVTLFRVYPQGVEARQAFARELSDPAYREALERHNHYNRRIFELVRERAMRGEGVLLSWTNAYRHADYDGEPGPPIAALKSFILSPWTDVAAVDLAARQVVEAREQLAAEEGSEQ
ncbi:MAG: aspartate aminotransferase family protein [Deltaproteobacteria bacterium]|nr:aspartate aminotransferase family protein [Deltaproteobacteria bacterium]